MLYVLDTDTVSLYGNGNTAIIRRVQSTPPEQLAVSVITIEEQLNGWYEQLRQAKTLERLVMVYERLALSAEITRSFNIVRFSLGAATRYETLLRQKLNVRKYDLRIAAIALESGATVVTRNVRDFTRVPGLVVANWSVEPSGE